MSKAKVCGLLSWWSFITFAHTISSVGGSFLDFITRLSKSKDYEAIFMVVDRLSKYSHFIPLKHLYSVKILAEIFTKEVIRLHGIPLSIMSDL